MASEDSAGQPESREKTIKTAGHIVKYSREIYHLESVEEVANLALEATPHFIEGHPSPAVIEVRSDDLRVLSSMRSGLEAGDDGGPLVRRAFETRNVVICADEGVEIAFEDEDIERVSSENYPEHSGAVTVAAPTVYADEIGETGAVLLVGWRSLDVLEEYHVRPTDYFAEHIATAITNIRSQKRLERARNDLAKRKEMVEVYDRLLRHDLGNDLQVIRGFSDHLVREAADDQFAEYAEKIQRTARNASELIDNVGQTVKTLKEEGEPEVKALAPILTDVVETVDTKFEVLTIDYDSEEFECDVYAGDLVDSVLANVISNAAVHNDEPIEMRLYAEEPTPDSVVIGMADDGKGIAEDVRGDIFEMGKKGPDSEGTGFGLGLARTLVESYGGTIDVRESDRGGADFRVTLETA